MAVQEEVANKACATLLFGLASGKLPEIMQAVSGSQADALNRSSLLGCLNGADSSISIDPAKFERVVKDDQPLKQAHDAATEAVASALPPPLPDDDSLGTYDEAISVDDLRDKCFSKMMAFDAGTLNKLFQDLADETKTVPDVELDEVADEAELDGLRLKALGRFTDALDSGLLDQALDSLKADVGKENEPPPETAEKPKRSKYRASVTEMPPGVPTLAAPVSVTETSRVEATHCEVTSPQPQKKRLSAADVPPAVPTQQDLEASKAEPVKMRSRWRASLSEVPPDVPLGAAGHQQQSAQKAEEPPPSDAKEADSELEAQLRLLARDVLIEASSDGRLAAALSASGNDEEVAKATANAPSGPSAPAVGSNAAPTPPVQAIEASPAPPATMKVMGSSSTTVLVSSSATATVLEAVAQRDRRVGELLAMISEAKSQIADREDRCAQIEDKLSAARADIAHLELDVEWYKRALDGAKERSGVLEERKRQLLGALDGHTLKMRHAGIDAIECGMSAPSEVSTATGGGTQSSIGCFTPGTGQALPSDVASPRR